mgnify:CR=1 FL=1
MKYNEEINKDIIKENIYTRRILIDWIMQIQMEKINEKEYNNIYILINIYDRIISKEKKIPQEKIQLVGIAGLMIVLKHEEDYEEDRISIREAEELSMGQYGEKEIRGIEKRILEICEYKIMIENTGGQILEKKIGNRKIKEEERRKMNIMIIIIYLTEEYLEEMEEKIEKIIRIVIGKEETRCECLEEMKRKIREEIERIKKVKQCKYLKKIIENEGIEEIVKEEKEKRKRRKRRKEIVREGVKKYKERKRRKEI